ncbi:MAG: helix-turn-helix domain-containing protein [Burkholderiaceae bacterium]
MNQTQFGAALGKDPQTITNWKQRGLPPEHYVDVAKVLGVTVEELVTGTPAVKDLAAAVAAGLGLTENYTPFVQPVSINWEHVLTASTLPARFTCKVPDDALSPWTPKGTPLVFDTAVTPTPGCGVLIEDRSKQRFVRRFAPRGGGQWLATTHNDAYAQMDSEQDGLRILAVATGRMTGTV